MAGFRLWEHVSIEDLLNHMYKATLEEIKKCGVEIPESAKPKILHAMKRIINEDIYASPACGTSSLCRANEEGRAKPWSYQSANWGLVPLADPSLDRK
jgi:hypothetical protein